MRKAYDLIERVIQVWIRAEPRISFEKLALGLGGVLKNRAIPREDYGWPHLTRIEGTDGVSLEIAKWTSG